MQNLMIDSEDKIRRLIKLTDNLKYIEETKKALSDMKNITESDALLISAMSIGEAIKTIIPERQYKRLIIQLWPEGDEKENSLGYEYMKDGKYVVEYTELNRNKLTMDEDLIYKIQCFFTFSHELYHAKQAIDAKDEFITFESFLYCLEMTLRENVPGFYEKEYKKLYLETAAEGVGIIMATNFLEKYNTINKENVPRIRKILMELFKPNHHIFGSDEELKEYIKFLLKVLRDNIHTFGRKYKEDPFIKFPMLKYLIDTSTGELENPKRLQDLIDNSYMMDNNIDTERRIRLLKILKELSFERQQSFLHK